MFRSRRRQRCAWLVVLSLAACPGGPFTGTLMAGRQTSDERNELAAEAERGGDAEQQSQPRAVQQEGEATYPPNRLADETSPYLLKHAHNPVRWQPWDEQALAEARDQNKVIFLSIGYSSCHWCHVMERETFMDDEIAALLNENFVCIKVDREERPDIDTIYMTSLNIYMQLTTGRPGGGWPLSMFLTPEGEPFFGGSYFPARDGDRQGQPGFLTIAKRVTEAWAGSRDRIRADAERLAEFTRSELDGERDGDGAPIDPLWVNACLDGMKDRFDAQYGGFGFSPQNAELPKFPEASNLLFLFDASQQGRLSEDERQLALKMLTTTLDKMAQGGIRDHIGGGFHRYSVDRYWRIPHFEKMLYDNAQLLSVYSRATEVADKPVYREVVAEIVQFLEREMRDSDGGFYSALDAESEGEEGRFYRWTRETLDAFSEAPGYSRFASVYGLTGPPNFEDAYYVPQLNRPLAAWAEQFEVTRADLAAELAPLRQQLLERRGERQRPLTDPKILTSWNGLAIRGLADAGRILEQPHYVELARDAAEFVWTHLQVEGRLMRTSTGGEVSLNGYLEDYADLIDGLIALHEATGEAVWLERAATLQEVQDQLFWEEEAANYFFTSTDHESLLARATNATDGAQPSGASVTAGNLLYLADALERPQYRQRCERMISGTSGLIESFPIAAPRLLISVGQLTSSAESED